MFLANAALKSLRSKDDRRRDAAALLSPTRAASSSRFRRCYDWATQTPAGKFSCALFVILVLKGMGLIGTRLQLGLRLAKPGIAACYLCGLGSCNCHSVHGCGHGARRGYSTTARRPSVRSRLHRRSERCGSSTHSAISAKHFVGSAGRAALRVERDQIRPTLSAVRVRCLRSLRFASARSFRSPLPSVSCMRACDVCRTNMRKCKACSAGSPRLAAPRPLPDARGLTM